MLITHAHRKNSRVDMEQLPQYIADLVAASKRIPEGANVEHWVRQYVESRLPARSEFDENLLLLSDSYKSRTGCSTPRRQVVSHDKINEAEAFFAAHFGRHSLFNRKGWEHIVNYHGGHLPLSILAVPEGTVVPNHNVLLTVVNTDPECFWLTNFVESLLVQVWYPCTVATISRAQKIVISEYLRKTGTVDPTAVDFKLHDFGFRGVSSVESSAIGGAAHLLNFRGTDTMTACALLQQYYKEPMAGFSVPASEHSTMTSWGQDHECDAFKNMLIQYPEGLVACVSDSWDIFQAVGEFWGNELKDLVLARKGRLVVRPDSGDPVEVVLRVLEILGGRPGLAFEPHVTTTSTGHRLLPLQIRIIQGDAVDIEMIKKIYAAMDSAHWAADNVGFGSGGALLQKMNRDTQKFAFKCSAAVVDGIERDVYKDPVTDPGKKSKRGRLMLIHEEGGHWSTVKKGSPHPDDLDDELVEVFRNGHLLVDQSLGDIRQRCRLE